MRTAPRGLPRPRMVAAPASRRYFAGWFTEADIHVLAPPALERRASKVPGSREALLLSPLHEYSHLVIGANNADLPPPFSPAAFRRYVRWAWLCEGGAVWLSGQTPYLRAAIVRRLREGALVLAAEQRAVRAGDQRGRRVAGPPLRDAGRGGRDVARPQRRELSPDRLERPLRELRGGVLARLDRDDRELVTPVAGDRVVGAHARPEGLSHAPEDLVAGQVAVRLVHLLEVVEIEDHERERRAVPGRALELALERLVHRRVVQAAGERVRARGQRELLMAARVAAGGRRQLAVRLQQLQP